MVARETRLFLRNSEKLWHLANTIEATGRVGKSTEGRSVFIGNSCCDSAMMASKVSLFDISGQTSFPLGQSSL